MNLYWLIAPLLFYERPESLGMDGSDAIILGAYPRKYDRGRTLGLLFYGPVNKTELNKTSALAM